MGPLVVVVVVVTVSMAGLLDSCLGEAAAPFPKAAILSQIVGQLPAVSGQQGKESDNRVKEIDVQVEDGKGMDDRGVFQPAGYEIKEKFIYKEPREKLSEASGPVFPQGLGNVIFAGCFGTNYQPGDQCYDFKKANPFLCLDLLDGAMFMGVGFDVTETYTSESRRKGLLQRKCHEKRYFHEKEVPDNLVAQGIYDYNINTMSYSSAQSYQKELASNAGIALTSSTFSKEMKSVSAGAGGSYGGIGASFSVSNSWGNEQSQSQGSSDSSSSQQRSTQRKDVYIAVLEADILIFEMFQDSVKPDDLRWEFVSEFLSLPSSYHSVGAVMKFQDFILRWGTHYVKYAKFGGQLKMVKTKEATSQESFSTFQQRSEREFQRAMSTMSSLQVQAKVTSPWVNVEAGYGSSNSEGSSSGSKTFNEQQELSRSYQEDAYGSTKFEIEGGNPAIASAIFDAFSPAFKSDFKNWVESIPEYAKPFDFKLGNIADLLNFNVQSLLGDSCSNCFELDQHNGQCQVQVVNTSDTVVYNCSDIDNKQGRMTNQRLALQRAVEVYMKEGPIPVYDLHVEGGPINCERDGAESFEQDGLHPSWDDIQSHSDESDEVRIVFDMRRSIPGVIMANAELQVRFFDKMWYVVDGGRIRLYDGFGLTPAPGEQQVNIRGLVMTYNNNTGLFKVTNDAYARCSERVKANGTNEWLKGSTVARAQYINILKVAKVRGFEDLVTSLPCVYRWSNVHLFNPFDEGRCIRFTASSSGSIYVILAVIPSNTDTWYHIQITSDGVGIYKALKLQEVSMENGGRGQGSDVLYQTYFVCVAAESERTRIFYGSAHDNEKTGHSVYLEYVDAKDNLAVKFYTFGSGERPVDVMDITIMAQTFLDFTCKGELGQNVGGTGDHVCDKDCHAECDPFFSCKKPKDPTTCGQCAHLSIIRYQDDVLECVRDCPDGYQRMTEDDTVKCRYVASCLAPFTYHSREQKRCYYVGTNVLGWDGGYDECAQLNAHLVDVSTKAEPNTVYTLLNSQDLRNTSGISTVGGPVNLGDASLGVNCSASAAYSSQYSCEKAVFDGSESHGSNHEWVTRENTAIGAWIQVNFPGAYTVTSIRLLQRCYRGYQNKDVEFLFSDGSTVSGRLHCFDGSSISACSGQFWQSFWIPAKTTTTVRIEIKSVCQQRYNGFREIKLFGYRGVVSLTSSSRQQVNLAEPIYGTTCSSSTPYSSQFSCDKALEGSEHAGENNEWVTERNQAVGSWIQVHFPRAYTVTGIQLLSRCYTRYQNRGVQFIFSDGSTQNEELTRYRGSNRFDCTAQYWQTFPVNNKISNSVRVKVTSVYTQDYNGFREIRVIGHTGEGPATLQAYWTSGRKLDGEWTWTSANATLEASELSWIRPGTLVSGDCLALSTTGLEPRPCGDLLRAVCEKPDFDG